MSFTKTLLLLALFASAASAQQTEALQAAAPAAVVPLLSPDHVYYLLMLSIFGSLGVLGLLLGLDKAIILFFKGDRGDMQKYSSESVARILPLIIEGITVILVILTLIILGASRIVSAEGTLGILGSIVGYVLGKSSRKPTPPSTGIKP